MATGKFDGCYSNRFKGIAKKKFTGAGFRIPEIEAQERVINDVIRLGNDIFKVPSFESANLSYTVDMDIGMVFQLFKNYL